MKNNLLHSEVLTSIETGDSYALPVEYEYYTRNAEICQLWRGYSCPHSEVKLVGLNKCPLWGGNFNISFIQSLL